MNTPQENRIKMIVDRARSYNNDKDCDVIEDATRQLEASKTLPEAIEAIDYLCASIMFRGGEQCRDDIWMLKFEIKAYESFYEAHRHAHTGAIEYFNRECSKVGNQTRII